MADKLAVVTGITGFIAQHVAAQLIEAGWAVRGTLRTRSRAEEARAAIAGLVPKAAQALTFAEASLESDSGWREAVAGAQAVVHVASPIPLAQPRDRMALVALARDGALRVLKASRDANVKNVVLTSSVAAIADGHGRRAANRVFSEADWSNPDGPNVSPYARSKTIAERAAWDFVKREKPSYAFSVVNPGLVLGPVLSKDYGVSPEVVRRLMAGEVPGAPRLGWEIVDVRDVASLHVLALQSPAANGERFIASSGFLWMSEMAAAIRAGLPQHARKVPKGKIPDFVLRLLGLFDPAIRGLLPELGRKVVVSHEKAQRLLGWSPRDPKEATVATAESLVRHGIV